MNRFNSTVPADQYLGRLCLSLAASVSSSANVFMCVCVCCLPADSNVLFYLSDAVTQLLEHKEEYTQFGVIRYFAE